MHLNLSKKLSTNTIAQIIELLQGNSFSITSLDLSVNRLTKHSADELEKFIYVLADIAPALHSLNLAGNSLASLTLEEQGLFFQAIASLPKLRLLDLSANGLQHGEPFKALALSSSLKVLKLPALGKGCSSSALVDMMKSLSTMPLLSALDLSFQQGLNQEVCQALATLPNLQLLNLNETGLCKHSTQDLVSFFNIISNQTLRFLQLPYYVFTDVKGNIQRPQEELVQILGAITSCAREIDGPGLKNLSDEDLFGLFGTLPENVTSLTLPMDWTEERSIEEWCNTFLTLSKFHRLKPNLCLRGLGRFNDDELAYLFDELARILPDLKELNLMSLTPKSGFGKHAPTEHQVNKIVLPYLAKSKVSTCYWTDSHHSVDLLKKDGGRRKIATLQELCLKSAANANFISDSYRFFSGKTRAASHEVVLIAGPTR